MFLVAADLASMAAGDKLQLRGVFVSGPPNLLAMMGATLLCFSLTWVAKLYKVERSVLVLAKYLFILITAYTSIQIFFISADMVEIKENATRAQTNYNYWHDAGLLWSGLFLLIPLLAMPWRWLCNRMKF